MPVLIHKYSVKLFMLIIVLFPLAVFSDETISQKIIRVQYDGAALETYFIGSNSWTSSCPSSTYVMVRGDLVGRDQMLSIGLTAQASGKSVSFIGVCDASRQVFVAHYMALQ